MSSSSSWKGSFTWWIISVLLATYCCCCAFVSVTDAASFLLSSSSSSTSTSFRMMTMLVDRRQAILLPFGAAAAVTATTSGLLFSSKSTNNNNDNIDFGPFVEGYIPVSRNSETKSAVVNKNDDVNAQLFYNLYFRIYNLSSNHHRTPLVICHGGPSLPSQYLYPIVPLLSKSSPIIFYDQLGCGKSDRPKDPFLHSTENSVEDLNTILKYIFPKYFTANPDNDNDDSDESSSLSPSFHLVGHSYGGLLAYKFASQQQFQFHPKSLILSNTPTNILLANQEYDRLYNKNPITFDRNHVCRVPMPSSWNDAVQHAGTVWGGMGDVLEDIAEPLVEEQAKVNFPPTLVISGGYDFSLSTSNEQAWNKQQILNLTVVHLEDCGHYPFYEDGPRFGHVVEDFVDSV